MLTAEPIHTFPTENYQRATHTKIKNIKRKEEGGKKETGRNIYIYFFALLCVKGDKQVRKRRAVHSRVNFNYIATHLCA